MDEMEYLPHNSQPAGPTRSQTQHTGLGAGAGVGTGTGAGQGIPQTQIQSGPGPHSQPQHSVQYQAQNHNHTQQPQPSGCPYFRGAEHHQSHYHQHPSHLPLPPQHPQFSQQQHALINPHQPHSQLHPQPQPQIQHQGFLSQPQNRNNSPQHGLPLLYDPVHPANNWYPAIPWSGTHAGLPSQLQHHHSRTSSSDTYFNNSLSVHPQGPSSGGLGVGSVGAPGGSAIHGLGLIHGQTPQHQLPHHEPFTPFFYRPQAPSVHRYPGIAPGVSSHGQNQTNNPTNTNMNQSSMNAASSLPGPQQPPPSSQAGSRGISLPALHPSAPQPQFTANMSGSGESTPEVPTNRRSIFGNMADPPPPHGSTGNENSAPPADAAPSRSATTSLFGEPGPSGLEAAPPARSDQPALSTPPPLPNAGRRRPFPARAATYVPDYDSDDELDQLEDDHQTLRFIEQFSVGGEFPRDMGEAQVRAHQILRGQMPNKRVASKKALSQLQSVEIDSLEESERTCVICYNDFGVENPEGINEAPLRLPSCKHIFGDHCIKKWFEESDSCPYCRDKVPSETIVPSGAQYIRDLYRQFPGRAHNGTGRSMVDVNNLRVVHRDDSRYDSSPPRAWQTGDRRSPPSEASESRRRTRPRHSSFRGTPSTASSSRHGSSHAGGSSSMAAAQQSTARERVNPPNLPRHRYSSAQYSHQLLTPLPTTQFMAQRAFYPPASSISRLSMPSVPSYQPAEPAGLNSPPPMPPQVGGFGPMANADGTSSISNPYQPQVLGGPSGTTLPPGGDPLPGPAQLDAYSQQLPSSASLPPVVAADDLSFGTSTNTGPNTGMLRFSRTDGVLYLMQ